MELWCVGTQFALSQPLPASGDGVHGVVGPGREGVVGEGSGMAVPVGRAGPVAVRQAGEDRVPGRGVQVAGREVAAALLGEGRVAGRVLRGGQPGESGEHAFAGGQFAASGFPAQEGRPCGPGALEAVLAHGEEQGVAGAGGEPQPGAVGTVEEGGAGAQPGHVLTQQGSEHAQELAGFGRHGARGTIGPGRPGFVGGTGRGGGHGVISHR